jgi:DNA repair exonuclease SbcCD nuclease subunit
MNIVVFSDLHLDDFVEFSHIDPITGLNTRFSDGIRILYQISEYCEKRKPELVLFLGDMFHNSKKISVAMLDEFVSGVSEIATYTPIIALPGQHDHFARDGELHTISPFKEMFLCTFSTLGNYQHKQFNFIGCPNRKEMETQRELLVEAQSLVDPAYQNVFLGHFLVKEIMEKDRQPFGKDGIEFKDLPRGCDLYLLGDYHQHVHVPKLNLVSVGATNQHRFGTTNRPQGGFLDISFGKKISLNRIETNAPIFITIQAGDKSFPKKYDKKNFYRVIGCSKKEEDEIRRQTDGWDIRFEGKVEKIDPDFSRRSDIKLDMAPQEVVKQYASLNGADEELLKKGLEYLQ